MTAEREPETTPLRVFVSYARADREVVMRLVQALEAAGLEIWWDDRLRGGEAFAGAIERALLEADAVVVAWSAVAVRSDWVRDEAAHARDRGRLIAISLDGVAPPLGFGQYHSIDYAHWRGQASAREVAQLLAAISAVAGKPVSAPRERGRRPAPPSRRRVLIGAGSGVAAACAVGGGLLWSGRSPWSRADPHSIAVLPFASEGDAAQAYFSEGVAEELRTTLARSPMLRVAAQTSSNVFRGVAQEATVIAGKLDVAFLLEGSVRRVGDVVRIAATLIEGRTGLSRWSDSFDRNLRDIFAVQSEIATTVAAALSAQLGEEAIQLGGTQNPAAYDDFLKGQALFNLAADETTDRAALAALSAAVAADPDYAEAHALRSRALGVVGNLYARGEELASLYDASVAAAKRAVALAPALAAAQLALGFARFNGLMDVRGARQPYERARALGAGNAEVLLLCSLYLSRIGRFGDALDAVRRALARDPLNARVHRALGTVLYDGRRFAAAIGPFREALRINPAMGGVHASIGNALFAQGDVAGAIAEYRQESSDLVRLAGLAIAQHRIGRRADAEVALAELIRRHGDNALYQIAEARAQWGDRDAAFAALARAYRSRDTGVLLMLTDPMLDPLRADPRFATLRATLGF